MVITKIIIVAVIIIITKVIIDKIISTFNFIHKPSLMCHKFILKNQKFLFFTILSLYKLNSIMHQLFLFFEAYYFLIVLMNYFCYYKSFSLNQELINENHYYYFIIDLNRINFCFLWFMNYLKMANIFIIINYLVLIDL